MIPARIARQIGRVHKWVGLLVGVQVLFWMVSGVVFSLSSIERVRGENLVSHYIKTEISVSRINVDLKEALKKVAADAPLSVELKQLAGEAIYLIRDSVGLFIVSAETGRVLSPLNADQIEAIAKDVWVGEGDLLSVEQVTTSTSGYNGSLPVWRAEFEGKGKPQMFISPTTGEVVAVRTDQWRLYDFLWKLHVMDWDDGEDTNHIWLTLAAIAGLTLTLFGFALLFHRFGRTLARSPKTD